jgi:hypothetical protein
VCPHLALFGSTPSYEHLSIFGCVCYPNTTATAPHKLSPRSTRCVFLGSSTDHKGYRCLDLSTSCLVVSRHMVFDEHSFPLAASPNPTDLDFLCESGSMVLNIETRLTTTGTSTPTSCRAPKIPPGFEPLVAPLPAPAVPPGFLPRATTTVAPRAACTTPPAAPHVAPTAPTAVTDGPPPRTWSASPVAYVRRPQQPAPASTTPPPPLQHPPVGGQGMVVPVLPPENPHRIITLGKTSFRVVPDRLILTATASSPTPPPIPTSARAAFTDPNWRAAMEDEYGALMSNGTWELVPRA